MNKGDIVLVPFPFSDLSGSKLRPALILCIGNLDVTVAFISTQLNSQDEFDIIISPSAHNGLKKISVLKLSKIATLENVDDLCKRIDEAAKYMLLENMCVSPQCGFSSTHHGNSLTHAQQWKKLELAVKTAKTVWG